MARKTGLGKGLDALIPTWQEESLSTLPANQIFQIAIDKISPNPRQPRKVFSAESLQELANSIQEHGILQPLILVQIEGEERYTLIAGERRWRAAALAGLQEVPAIVRNATLQEQLEFAIVENVQREDLNALERARAYQSLLDEFSLTHDEIAQKVGKSRAAVTNTLRLLNLPGSVQQALQDDLIKEGHARPLLALNSVRAKCRADILGFKAFRQKIGTDFQARDLFPKVVFQVPVPVNINASHLMGEFVAKLGQPGKDSRILFRERRTR